MKRTLLLAALSLGLGGAACANYVLDTVPHVGGDGGLGFDGSLPGDPDGGTADFDGSLPGSADTGIGPICSTEAKTIALSPLDLLVVLDVSGSMDYDQKWGGVKSALKSFVTKKEFEGLGVGLQYFPLRAQCNLDAYQAPAVTIATLPDVGPTIASSLDLQQMSGGTPTVQVMEGATAYAAAWLAKNPTHKSVIVLATDGMPDGTCKAVTVGLPNSLENALTVARAAARATPPVKTFVIGVGKDLGPLNDLARAGGTDKAIIVDVAKDADVAFLAALTKIRRDALGCDFSVPLSDDVNRKSAQVRFELDEGGEVWFQEVPDQAGCAAGKGWYFDDPKAPTKLMFCDDTCTTVTQGKTGRLFVEFACGQT